MTDNLSTERRPPVFIIGGSRTGSEMLKTMLSVSPDLDFADEMVVRAPWWLHKDLESSIRDHVGDLGRVKARSIHWLISCTQASPTAGFGLVRTNRWTVFVLRKSYQVNH